MPDVNPLTQVHRALWSILLARADLTADVPAANRVKLTEVDIVRAEKAELHHADVPEVRVARVGLLPVHDRVTSLSYLRATWEIQVTSGDMEQEPVDDADWQIYRAMQDWRSVMASLVWKTKRFIEVDRCKAVQLRDDDHETNRGMTGWVARWRGETDMWFTPSDLTAAD